MLDTVMLGGNPSAPDDDRTRSRRPRQALDLTRVTWADVAVAAAFVLGIIAGAIGVIRITRYLLDYLARRPPPE